jgi:amino acid transporter
MISIYIFVTLNLIVLSYDLFFDKKNKDEIDNKLSDIENLIGKTGTVLALVLFGSFFAIPCLIYKILFGDPFEDES